jgi:threonine dehydrogenase-like Zn-dependent dehydrogenase
MRHVPRSAANALKAADKTLAADGSETSAEAKIAGKVVLESGQVFFRHAAVSDRPPHFALLQLIVGGICNTDLELQRGYYSFHGTPGHEFVARVISCDNPRLLNQRVVGEINLVCGHCDFCKQNLGRHCRNRTVLGILGHSGAFAEYFTLPEANLRVVPDIIPDEHAVFVEPLAAACEILDQVTLKPGSEVAVVGDGKLGLLITQVLLTRKLRVTLFGRHESKLQLARAAGAKGELTGNMPPSTYSCVVECSGSREGLADAIRMTRPRGTVVMKSTIHDQVQIDMAPVIVNEISLVGSRCGRFEPALALLATKRVNVGPMIEAEFRLQDAAMAFERAATRGTLKVLLRP